MAWIYEDPNLKLPNVIKVMSMTPKAMGAVQELCDAVNISASSISKTQIEAIATVVSVANKCRY